MHHSPLTVESLAASQRILINTGTSGAHKSLPRLRCGNAVIYSPSRSFPVPSDSHGCYNIPCIRARRCGFLQPGSFSNIVSFPDGRVTSERAPLVTGLASCQGRITDEAKFNNLSCRTPLPEETNRVQGAHEASVTPRPAGFEVIHSTQRG